MALVYRANKGYFKGEGLLMTTDVNGILSTSTHMPVRAIEDIEREVYLLMQHSTYLLLRARMALTYLVV